MLKSQFKTLDRDILHLIVCPLHMTQRPPSLVQIQMANGFQAKEILMRRRKKINRKKKTKIFQISHYLQYQVHLKTQSHFIRLSLEYE